MIIYKYTSTVVRVVRELYGMGTETTTTTGAPRGHRDLKKRPGVELLVSANFGGPQLT